MDDEAVAAASPRLAAWYRWRFAEAAASAGRAEAADQGFEAASRILFRAGDSSARAEVLRAWAGQLAARRENARARELLEEAVAMEGQRGAAGLSAAFTQVTLADLADREGDLATAERAWLAALQLEEQLVPEGLEVSRALDTLGYLALWRGDPEAARERLSRSEAIQRRISTSTFEYAAILNKLSLLAEQLGDLEQAEKLERQALSLDERLAPGTRDHGGALMNLAELQITRGELAAGEDLLRQSVKLFEGSAAEPWQAAGPYANLGTLALYRGDLAVAQSYLDLALDRMRQGPDSIELADVYTALAEVARRRQLFAEARAWEQRALAITERLALGGLGRSARLEALARIESESGDFAKAEAFLRQADAAVLEAAPGSPQADSIRRELGRLLVQTGRLAEAESLYREILANLRRRGLMGTTAEAETRNLLGDAQRRRGDLPAAEESFCRAMRILDLQRPRLGGSLESRSWFESETQTYAFDCLSTLAERGRHAEAFHTLERGKARVFLQLLAERDLRFAELPPELKAERMRQDADYDRILSRLSRLGADDGEAAALRVRLEDLKAARETLIARLRRRSPGLAALQVPAPFDLAAARRALDHGTVLLAYAVGPEQSYLFVVRPRDAGGRGLEVHRLPIGKPALQRQIEAYRRLLTDPESDLAALNARGSRLYKLLLKPAEQRLGRAQRLLISADGPLHLLPWAALRHRQQYLAQWRPIHLIASMTVYRETRQSRRRASDPRTWRLVAFGNPAYPQLPGAPAETFADSEVRSALRRGAHLDPLPGTREEIREIAALFPKTEVYLGKEATEERAKRLSPQADVIHFAGHGLIDERFPLDSGLALTIPQEVREGQENGLLQAWEIFESVRLDAQLVTLSACDTALGREMGGEGLLGLTRAFQYAGARSVLASLWSVSDVSTATLMKRFYTYLRAGKAKDEALRTAQMDLIRSAKRGLSHPYNWAGFALYGDWR